MDYNSFIVLFPEFNTLEQTKVESYVNRIALETNGYQGISNDNIRLLLLGYSVAEAITIDIQETEKTGRVKKLKSRNDEIEYAIKDLDPFINKYSLKKQELLNTSYLGGFIV